MESLELQNLETFVARVQQVLQDALSRFAAIATAQATQPVEFSDLAISSFRQTWPDASCGFGGIAAQVVTDAQTVVVHWPLGNTVLVYVRGEFAYRLNAPTQAFWEAVGNQRLPGAADPRKGLSQE